MKLPHREFLHLTAGVAGNAPTVNAVLGTHVTAGVANYADVVGHLKAGTLRALATPSPTRIETLPDVPTVAESGHKEFEYEIWFGMLAPVKTPAPRLRIFEPAMTLAA